MPVSHRQALQRLNSGAAHIGAAARATLTHNVRDVSVEWLRKRCAIDAGLRVAHIKANVLQDATGVQRSVACCSAL